MVDGCIIIIHEVFTCDPTQWNKLRQLIFNSDNLFLHVLNAIAYEKTRTFFKALVTKRNRSTSKLLVIIVKSQSAWDVRSHSWHVKVLDFAPFRRSYVREFEVSHSKLVNRIIKITHAHNLHPKMLSFALFQFVRKKKANCLLQNFLKRF